jgi:hypothetical protein
MCNRPFETNEASRDFRTQLLYNQRQEVNRMTLQLELSPAEERELQASAARDGIPVGALVHRLLASALRQQKVVQRRAAMEAEAARLFAASGETDEEMEAYIQQTVEQVRAEMSTLDAQR